MFLLVGVHSKIKDCGRVDRCTCPVCGRTGSLHICNQYMTPHIFFIPTFRFHCKYIATCASCASVMELDVQKGRALEKGRDSRIFPEDLRVLQDNAVTLCPGCGARQPRGNAFCGQCGRRL